MKDTKGITLISLIVYIIGMIVIMAIISIVLSFYNKNMVDMNDTSDVNAEFNKFDTKMVQETKTAGNSVQEATSNTITFTNGNTYTFGDEKIYQNTIVVCKYVKEFSVNYSKDGEKQVLNIYILFNKGKVGIVKNLTYVVENP